MKVKELLPVLNVSIPYRKGRNDDELKEDDEDDYVSIPYRKGRNYKYAPEEKTK